jgi:transposase
VQVPPLHVPETQCLLKTHGAPLPPQMPALEQPGTSEPFSTGLLDLSNPAARDWIKGIIHLEARLDRSFIRAWTRDLYAERGRPNIDPVVSFKPQLVMFFEGIRSERQLIETASLSLAHRWYLGYALNEDLPDRFSLTRIRQQLGIEVFERFFEKIVDLCQEARLVWGRELYFNATRVRVEADTDSLVSRFYVDVRARLADVFGDSSEPTDEPAVICEGDLRHVPAHSESADGVQEATPPERWNLLELRRVAPGRPSHCGYRRTSDFGVSTTDPNITPMAEAPRSRATLRRPGEGDRQRHRHYGRLVPGRRRTHRRRSTGTRPCLM